MPPPTSRRICLQTLTSFLSGLNHFLRSCVQVLDPVHILTCPISRARHITNFMEIGGNDLL
ncbi:hypothetical protein EV130_10580 [Rhizobium azibense]|uniref:Uncharacterized protein n=1 Tax=Rhizobium azibense TaxID=1136135 RepID=A0A4R3R346_9HYPH|nr:hypothetical protein EV130_10580 [Rhizobium azibense]TCU40287.1 hypothetical protein EV129_102428 [Rhizobium azibense]